jgi:DNA-binding transcriptional regulator YiaG
MMQLMLIPENMGVKMLTKDAIEFRRLIEKSGLRRADIAAYLDVKERVIYKWQGGESKVPKAVLIALQALVKEI